MTNSFLLLNIIIIPHAGLDAVLSLNIIDAAYSILDLFQVNHHADGRVLDSASGKNVKSRPKSSKLTQIVLSCPKIMKAA